MMKIILLALALSNTASAATTVTADSIRSSDRTKTWTMPGSTGTLARTLDNVATATSLAANPTDCGAGTKAISIDASGNLTCSAVDLTADVSGTMPVANGGTGASTLTANNVLLGNGASAVQFVAPGTSGNVLTSNGTTWQSTPSTAGAPAFVTLSGNPGSTSSGSVIIMPTEISDPSGINNVATGVVSPPSGKTICHISAYFTGDPNNMHIIPYVNGSSTSRRCSDTDTNGPGWSPVNCWVPVVGGTDTLTVRPSGATMSGSANNRMEIVCF